MGSGVRQMKQDRKKTRPFKVEKEGDAHHYEFLPKGQISNKEYYLEVIRRLREAIQFSK